MWWSVAECGGVWWRELNCGGRSWIVVECGGVRVSEGEVINIHTRKYMHAETLALLTKPLYFPNMKYLK